MGIGHPQEQSVAAAPHMALELRMSGSKGSPQTPLEFPLEF